VRKKPHFLKEEEAPTFGKTRSISWQGGNDRQPLLPPRRRFYTMDKSTSAGVLMHGDLPPQTPKDVIGAGRLLHQMCQDMMTPLNRIDYMRRYSMAVLDEAMEEASIETKLLGQMDWCELTAEDTARQHHSSLAEGLPSQRAKEQLELVGSNELEGPRQVTFLSVLLAQLEDIMLWLPLLAGLIYIYGLHDMSTGLLMTGAFLVGIFSNAIGEHSTAESIRSLSEPWSQSASVFRDGAWTRVATRELVPGDIVELRSGDAVVADMRVATTAGMRVDESILTGESDEVEKTAEPLLHTDAFPKNMLFCGTSCTSGKCTGIVIATGMKSQVGLIAKHLQNKVPGGLSPLQKTMSRIGGIAGSSIMFVVALITAICYTTRYQDPEHPCEDKDELCFLMTAFVRGLMLGLSCIPTSLPMMTTMLLLIARDTIQKKQAVVRKMTSVETLGACTVICADKTGTLTEGKITVVEVLLPRDGKTNPMAVYPTHGLNPKGGFFRRSKLGEEDKLAIDACVKRGTSNYPLRNHGVVRAGDMDSLHLQALLSAASMSSYETRLLNQAGDWIIVGNMTEGALVVAAAKAGIGNTRGLALRDPSTTHPKVQGIEVPFSSARKLACTVHPAPDGKFFGVNLGPEATHVAIIKGAPERLLGKVSSSLHVEDGMLCVSSFTEEARKSFIKHNSEMAEAALRVMLMCFKPLTKDDMEILEKADATRQGELLTSDMVMAGAFGMADPARPTAKASIAKCMKAGMRVVMITGDQPATATAVGKALELEASPTKARLCEELQNKTEDEIDELVANVNIWARAQPTDKVTIVQSLQRLGHTVAMTGDGANDAAALKLADIGTAMGITGTAVAKGAADIILMNDDFSTIVDCVEEGRRAYNNVQTYVGYYLTAACAEVAAYSLTMLLDVPMPLGSIPILLQSMVCHIIPPMTLPKQPLPSGAMQEPPRRRDEDLVSRSFLRWVLVPWLVIWCTLWTSLSSLSFWMNIGFTRARGIEGITRYNAVADGLSACEYSGHLNPDGYHIKDRLPFHCACQVRAFPWSDPEVVEQWQSDASSVQNMLQLCHSEKEDSWCWKDPDLSFEKKPLLKVARQCGVSGTRGAEAMNFVALAVAEHLLILSISSERLLIAARPKNNALVIAVVFGLISVMCLCYIAPVAEVVSLRPLPLGHLLTAVSFSFVAISIIEVCKIGYRRELRKGRDLRRFHARAAARGLVNAWASDSEVESFRQAYPELGSVQEEV